MFKKFIPGGKRRTIENSRKGGWELRKMFKNRLKKIEIKRIEAQRKKPSLNKRD